MNPATLQRAGRELVAQCIARDKELPLDTVGESMGATIRSGDRVIVRHVPPAELRPGDIVVTRAEAGFTAHRIIACHTQGDALRFTTKGDARLLPDPPLAAADILGRVVEIHGADGVVDLRTPRARRAARCQLRYARFLAALGRAASACRPISGRLPLQRVRRLLLWPALRMGRTPHQRPPN